MPALSRWIVAYALLLSYPQISDRLGMTTVALVDPYGVIGWAGAGLMLAAGIASAQRRRSLRVGGIITALFISLVLTGIYTWVSASVWHERPTPLPRGACLSTLALASIALVWIIVKLRPREGIASRGYAVTFTPPRRRGDSAMISPNERN